MGTPKETLTADGLCLRQILGAPPQEWAAYVGTHPIGRKNLFQKRFLRSFFLKKATTPRPQAPPAKSKFQLSN